jgi:hypothetical protein
MHEVQYKQERGEGELAEEVTKPLPGHKGTGA